MINTSWDEERSNRTYLILKTVLPKLAEPDKRRAITQLVEVLPKGFMGSFISHVFVDKASLKNKDLLLKAMAKDSEGTTTFLSASLFAKDLGPENDDLIRWSVDHGANESSLSSFLNKFLTSAHGFDNRDLAQRIVEKLQSLSGENENIALRSLDAN